MKINRMIGAALFALACSVGPARAEVNYFSDFNDGIPDWGLVDLFGDPPIVTETDGQLSMRLQFPATMANLVNTVTGVAWLANHPIRDAETLEYRVDLIQTSHPDVLAGVDFNVTGTPSGEGLYAFLKDANQILLSKVIPGGGLEANFFHESTPIKHHNVTMSMALTGISGSVSITCRVLDLDTGGAVLFERTVLDTPAVDPTVSANISGLNPGTADSGPPFGLGGSSGPFLYLAQVTDGSQPEVEVVYDNFTWEYRSAARLAIEPAVRLSWPTFGTPFVVEGAPSVVGPWSPVNEPVLKTNGMNWMTVPMHPSQIMRVFRLSEFAP